MAKLENLEALLEKLTERELAKLSELERSVAVISEIDRKLTALAELDRKLDTSLAEMDRKLDTSLGEIDRKLDGVRKQYSDLEFLLTVAPTQATALLGPIARSRSQLRQDVFVPAELEQEKNGVFVEFGATNGVDLSNTWLLEKEFGWSAILAEPATCWHAALRKNRSSAIEQKCVWRSSGKFLNSAKLNSPYCRH